jgi:hypothetical protein
MNGKQGTGMPASLYAVDDNGAIINNRPEVPYA